MIRIINRILPGKLKETFYWRVSRHFNKFYTDNYDTIEVSNNLKIKGVSTDTISQQLFFKGYYDAALSALIKQIGKDGGLFIDVGANIGYCSLLFASQSPTCRVISFEPSLKNLELFRHNILQNNLCKQITVYPHAVGNEDSEMYFENGPEDQTGWGHLSVKPTENKVKVVRLDSIIDPEIKTIDFLKIDVEGFDLQVILGCEQLLKRGIIKVIVFEYHYDLINPKSEKNPLLDKFYEIINQLNYKIEKFGSHDYILTNANLARATSYKYSHPKSTA